MVQVALTREQKRFIDDRIASGRSRSAQEVIGEALWLLERTDRECIEREAKLAALRADIQEGIDSIERGEGIDGEEFFAHLETEHASREDR
jgi:antitoxin ParD1/3/4